MKKNWSWMWFGLSVALAGCGTTRSVTKAPAVPPNKMQAQLPDFSALGQASLANGEVQLAVAGDSLFKPGHTYLNQEGVKTIDALAAVLGKYPADSVTVAVYTDNSGGDAENLKVSQRRADHIKKELVKQGVSVDRITALGKGDVDPVGDNTTEAGRAQNRRAEFQVTTIS